MKLLPQRRQVNELMFQALLPGGSTNSLQGCLECPCGIDQYHRHKALDFCWGTWTRQQC